MIGETPAQEQLRQLLSAGRFVKIDGVREPEHAAAAIAAGADLIGFIFAPARRRVSPAVARACIEAARDAAFGRIVPTVGVFVDAPVAEIEAVVAEVGLDVVQLHGAEPPDSIRSLSAPAFKALRPTPESTREHVLADIDRYQSAAVPPVAILVDGYAPHATGGTGMRVDWTLAAEINAVSPIILAGGLDPENVRDAIRRVRPRGVDVSSGVEVNGVKNPELMARFVRSARDAFQDEVQ